MARPARKSAARKQAGARTPARRGRARSASPAARTPAARRAKVKARAATPRAVGAPSSGVAPGIQPITAYLAVQSVTATAAFLESALGFTRGVVLADGEAEPRYAEMRHGTSTVVLVPAGDTTSPAGGAAGLYTYVDDVDRRLASASGLGAVVTVAEDAPWGDRVGTVVDPDGYRWVLATFKKLAPFS